MSYQRKCLRSVLRALDCVTLFAITLVCNQLYAQNVTLTIDENVQIGSSSAGNQPSEKKMIPVGVVISLSGKSKDLAVFTKQGYELAVDKINTRGGVRVGSDFMKLELVFGDDMSDPAMAPRALESLIKKGVDFVMGPYGSTLTTAIAPMAEKYKVPFLSQGAARELYDKKLKYIFSPGSSGDQYLKPAVKMLGELAIARGRKVEDLKVMIIARTDPGSVDIKTGVIEAVKEWNMQLVADVAVSNDGKEVTSALEKASKLLPDLLVATVQAEGARQFVEMMAAQKVDVPMVAMTHCDAGRLDALKPKSDFILCSSQWDAFLDYTDSYFGSAVEFTSAYYLKYNMIPPYQTAGAASSVVMLADAIERSQSLEREKVRQALADTQLRTIFGEMRFDDKKIQGKPVILHQLIQGDYKVVYPQQVASERIVFPMPSWGERVAD